MSDVQSNQSGDTVPQTTGDISAQTPPPADPSAALVPSANADLAALANTQNNAFANGQLIQRNAEGEGSKDADPGVAQEGAGDGASALSDGPAPLTDVEHVSMLMWLHERISNWRAQIRAGRFPSVDEITHAEGELNAHLERV